jgi:hypothetical protein
LLIDWASSPTIIHLEEPSNQTQTTRRVTRRRAIRAADRSEQREQNKEVPSPSPSRCPTDDQTRFSFALPAEFSKNLSHQCVLSI